MKLRKKIKNTKTRVLMEDGRKRPYRGDGSDHHDDSRRRRSEFSDGGRHYGGESDGYYGNAGHDGGDKQGVVSENRQGSRPPAQYGGGPQGGPYYGDGADARLMVSPAMDTRLIHQTIQ